jgi:hypothetical protein
MLGHEMLRWFSEKIFSLASLPPAWLAGKDSPRFFLVRGMFAALFVILIICVVAFWPSRTTIARLITKIFPKN